MIAQIAAIVVPVFVLALMGFIWVRVGLDYEYKFVTRLTLEIGTPCLIFSTLVQTDIEPAAFQEIALAALSLYFVLGLLAWGVLRFLGLSLQTYLSPFIFSNSGNVGLPLSLFAFGPEGLAYAIAIFATMVVVNFSVGVWIVSGKPAPLGSSALDRQYGRTRGAIRYPADADNVGGIHCRTAERSTLANRRVEPPQIRPFRRGRIFCSMGLWSDWHCLRRVHFTGDDSSRRYELSARRAV